MEELKELLHLVERLPHMAMWALGGFALYKLLTYASTLGAITMILKLAINKAYEAYANPRPRVEKVEYKMRDGFISDIAFHKFDALIRSLKHHNDNQFYTGSYVHESAVEYLIQAYKEKKEREKKV